MEIQQLRHLVTAVDCGNLLKASDECHISQSGLSRSIRSLEDRLGLPLLIRTSKGVEPTVYGLSVVQRARLILNEVARSMDDLRAIQAAEIGEVTFGITQNYGYYLIPDVLAEMNADHPGIRLVVRTGGFLDLVETLKVGAIEFGFGLLGRMDDDPDIQVEALREHHSRVICRRDHPLMLKGEEVTPAELANARWATLRSMGFQASFINYFSTLGLRSPVQAVRTDSIAAIRELVATSDLLAVLPPNIVRDGLDLGKLAILDCDAPAEQTAVGFMFRTHSLVTPSSRLVIDRIRARLKRA